MMSTQEFNTLISTIRSAVIEDGPEEFVPACLRSSVADWSQPVPTSDEVFASEEEYAGTPQAFPPLQGLLRQLYLSLKLREMLQRTTGAMQ